MTRVTIKLKTGSNLKPRRLRHPPTTMLQTTMLWMTAPISNGQTWTPEAVDVREDRVIAFGAVPSSEVVYHYKIKAVNAGTFTTPPAYVESMYERTIKARGVAGTITVR